MWDFFVRVFIKNPKGQIVLGILVAVIFPSIIKEMIGGYIAVGLIISAIGVLRLIKKTKKEKKAIESQLPLYHAIVDALNNSGYRVSEFENKNDRIRSSVSLDGNYLGDIFLVAPPPSGSYVQFRHLEDMVEKNFQHAYSKKHGKNPGISASYWPDNSLVGATIEESAEYYSEKEKWLKNVASVFQGNSQNDKS